MSEPRFSLGRTVATPGVLNEVGELEIQRALLRHHHGDWGELCDVDKQANEDALDKGGRLLSAYRIADGTKFYIITEADRSATTALLPEEY